MANSYCVGRQKPLEQKIFNNTYIRHFWISWFLPFEASNIGHRQYTFWSLSNHVGLIVLLCWPEVSCIQPTQVSTNILYRSSSPNVSAGWPPFIRATNIITIKTSCNHTIGNRRKNVQPFLSKWSPAVLEACLSVVGSVEVMLIKAAPTRTLSRVEDIVGRNQSFLCWDILFCRLSVVVYVKPVILDDGNILCPVLIVGIGVCVHRDCSACWLRTSLHSDRTCNTYVFLWPLGLHKGIPLRALEPDVGDGGGSKQWGVLCPDASLRFIAVRSSCLFPEVALVFFVYLVFWKEILDRDRADGSPCPAPVINTTIFIFLICVIYTITSVALLIITTARAYRRCRQEQTPLHQGQWVACETAAWRSNRPELPPEESCRCFKDEEARHQGWRASDVEERTVTAAR